MTGPGRPKKDNGKEHTVATRLDDDEYKKLKALMRADGMTLAKAVRHCIRKVTGKAAKNDYKRN